MGRCPNAFVPSFGIPFSHIFGVEVGNGGAEDFSPHCVGFLLLGKNSRRAFNRGESFLAVIFVSAVKVFPCQTFKVKGHYFRRSYSIK